MLVKQKKIITNTGYISFAQVFFLLIPHWGFIGKKTGFYGFMPQA
jgi:hypothetical protein